MCNESYQMTNRIYVINFQFIHSNDNRFLESRNNVPFGYLIGYLLIIMTHGQIAKLYINNDFYIYIWNKDKQ